jgi:hypothetical protein
MVSERQFLKRARALSKGSWQDRGDGRYWIDHRTLGDDDLAALSGARDLTLWNVRLAPGSLARLQSLQVLDLRGGSAASLSELAGVHWLRALVVNQIRGLTDISAVSQLEQLEYLSLYGFPRIAELPSLVRLTKLKRVELGQMKNLADVSSLLAASALEELLFVKRLAVRVDDIRPLLRHPTLRTFAWIWEDVPASQAIPVLEALALPRTRVMFPAEWLAQQDQPAVRGTSGEFAGR